MGFDVILPVALVVHDSAGCSRPADLPICPWTVPARRRCAGRHGVPGTVPGLGAWRGSPVSRRTGSREPPGSRSVPRVARTRSRCTGTVAPAGGGGKRPGGVVNREASPKKASGRRWTPVSDPPAVGARGWNPTLKADGSKKTLAVQGDRRESWIFFKPGLLGGDNAVHTRNGIRTGD